MNNTYDFILTKYRTILEFKDKITDIIIEDEVSTKFGYTYYRIYINLICDGSPINEPNDYKYISIRIYNDLDPIELDKAENLGVELIHALKKHLWFNPFGYEDLGYDLSKLIKDERNQYNNKKTLG